MRIRRLAAIVGVLLPLSAVNALTPRMEAQDRLREDPRLAGLPPNATRCNLSIPIHIEMVSLNEARVGQVAQYRVEVESFLDPDLVQSSWVEYELPDRVRRASNSPASREVLGKVRSGSTQLAVIVPDAQRYEIRARYVVRLTDGQTISQTAVRHINIGNLPPEGMIDRIVDSDGNGIQVYRGVAVKN